MKEALLYKKNEDKSVSCRLCAHRCKIADKKFGFCGVRQNLDGILYTHVYAKPIAIQIDPIEKKPLYQFLPGSNSLSIATIGCNFRCGFCQNWDISQARPVEEAGDKPKQVAPEQIVAAALKEGCKSISYTYTEPTIFFEYALETCKLARKKGLRNIFVTNGYMTKDALEMIRPYLDAANIDLKFFKEENYRKYCAASLEPVLDSIKSMHDLGIWVEVTTLVIPGENDSEGELRGIARFIADLDRDIPWHISRFHPDYQFGDRQATPKEALEKASRIGEEAGLNYIYVGNVSGWGLDTHCPKCKKRIIHRENFGVLEYNIKAGKCLNCNAPIVGVFE